MEFSVSFLVGFLGLILAIVEIWKPKLSVLLENFIKKKIENVVSFQDLYFKQLKLLAKDADSVFDEVAKGIQPLTFEELKANASLSLYQIKSYLQFYAITLINFLILKPVKELLVFLNRLGNGRAVGGLGLLLTTIGFALGFYA
jgi:hypothetical protein